MNKVLIIGSGGREHALAWKFAQSPQVEKIFVAPGNPGINEMENCKCVDIGVSDFAALAEFAKAEEIALTMVGPEVPLVDGIVDYFEKENLAVFGPRANAAIIEGSKSFAKELMKKYDIPTAGYEVFTNFADASKYIRNRRPPFVLKADGLAAGKGVVIAENHDEAYSALAEMLQNKRFGAAGSTVVIEDFLGGTEFSYMAFVNGENVYPMVIAKDHKRAFDGDQGPNTGGMGAYSPVPQISEEIIEKARVEILLPTAKAMVDEGRPFCGILYAGLIATKAEAKVIEFNARFGDPETEVVLPRLENDLFAVITDILAGNDPELKWSDDNVLGIVLASKGYPDEYQNGFPITGLDKLEAETLLYHCGTKKEDNYFKTNGGRVLFAARKAENLDAARNALYKDVKKIKCTNLFYRTDIGEDKK
ncbi:MAG: phosphoribosylamine--glycine ligase [Defluviitaleaceae bacterium]|nr:phosphoribosylamine--glycine ligase [Defluviitaleaceae bacterium]MCL2261807.1 phosphoribosylamine--glycine ligase [Defluviitaleaceae bacterium]